MNALFTNALNAIHPTMVDAIAVANDGRLRITNDDASTRHLADTNLSSIKLTADTIAPGNDGSTVATHAERLFNDRTNGIAGLQLLADHLHIVGGDGSTKTPPAGNYDTLTLTTTAGKTTTFIADPFGHA